MKRKILSNLLKFSLLCVLAGFSNAEALDNDMASEFSPVDSNRVPEVLTMISESTKNNYEKIKSWQGKLDIVTEYLYDGDRAKEIFAEDINASCEAPKKLLEHRETDIEFYLDAENELLYVEYYNDSAKPLRYIDLENSRDLEAKGVLATRRAILTPEYQIDCTAETMRDGVVTSRKAVKNARPKTGSGCEGHPVYDPRGSLSVGEPVWEFFPMLIDYIKEHGGYSVGGVDFQVEERKTEDTNDYRIIMPARIQQGDEKFLIHEMVFSGENGFNIVSYETAYRNKNDLNKIILKRVILKYKVYDDVYVTHHRLEKVYEPQDGELNTEKTIIFKGQKVNESIPKQTFTYENLDLKNGDKFVDTIEGKEYIFQDANLVPITD